MLLPGRWRKMALMSCELFPNPQSLVSTLDSQFTRDRGLYVLRSYKQKWCPKSSDLPSVLFALSLFSVLLLAVWKLASSPSPWRTGITSKRDIQCSVFRILPENFLCHWLLWCRYLGPPPCIMWWQGRATAEISYAFAQKENTINDLTLTSSLTCWREMHEEESICRGKT